MTKGVKLISVTPNAEKTMAYCARVSSPHQENPEHANLLRFCIRKGHWSVFEQAHMTLEIETSRAIAHQIIRHWSFRFQEFSQRYAAVEDGAYIEYEARRQADKDRQSSIDDLPDDVKVWWRATQYQEWQRAYGNYKIALNKGIAKECARMILPLNTFTRFYMTGCVRSWIHYIQLRTEPNVQAEHREIALAVKNLFIAQFPVCAKALGWD